ncbi:MAG: hypothetical protein MJZ25_13140 [Fibrobacter sp.]|nr:hypothetical protein [Fibrobacter sp.]
MTLAESILAELKEGPKTTAYLKHKYSLSRRNLDRVMDTIGQTEPVYNPVPGKWALLNGEEKIEELFELSEL